jgi:nuclear pore complex protein Nup62
MQGLGGFNFGSATTTGSTAGTAAGTFNFGAPKTTGGTQTSTSTFSMPTGATNSPSTTGFGFPKQGGSPSAPFSFGTQGASGNTSTQPNANKPPMSFGTGGSFTAPQSNLTTSGALPKSGAPSAFTIGTSSTSGTTTAHVSFGTTGTTPIASFGTPSTTTSNPMNFGTTTTQSSTLNFSLKGTTTTNGSSTTTPTTTTGTTFGFPGSKPTTTTGSSTTTPTTTGTQLNFATGMTAGTTGTNPTPPLAFNTASSTTSTSATSTTMSTSTVPTVSNADVQAILKGKTLDSILNGWGNEINLQADAFMQQAHKVAEWDTELLKNKDKLTRLKDHLDSTSFAQDNLDRKLELIKEKQNDVNSVLKELEDGLEKMQTEQNVNDISKADKDRKKGYKLAEDINSQIDVIQGTLEELVTTLNEKRAVSSGQEEKPEAKIMAILNDHLITLQWIDQATLDLDLKVKEIEKSYRTYL